ncbi:MAG: hypothetical protein R3F61_31460 [Myxococcota bacterium]
MWLGTLLLACRPGPVAFEERAFEGTSADGHVRFEVELDGTSALFALQGDAWLAVDTLEGPDGVVLDWRDWVDDELLTAAVYTGPSQTVLNWPIREDDPPLTPGTWTLDTTVVDRLALPLDGVDVRAVVRTKLDDDLRRGTVSAVLLVPEGLDPALRDGAIEATERWRRVWRDHGLWLDVEVRDADLGLVVPNLGQGAPAVREAVALAGEADLVAWVGEEVEGFGMALGVSGSIPNASFDSPRGVLGLAALNAAGTDGVFTAAEIRLFGEVMAHEGAHFLGLFHPIELDFTRRDALDDTPACDAREACEDLLAGNLMFPYPICISDRCARADDLTPGQRAVLHRYTGVR